MDSSTQPNSFDPDTQPQQSPFAEDSTIQQRQEQGQQQIPPPQQQPQQPQRTQPPSQPFGVDAFQPHHQSFTPDIVRQPQQQQQPQPQVQQQQQQQQQPQYQQHQHAQQSLAGDAFQDQHVSVGNTPQHHQQPFSVEHPQNHRHDSSANLNDPAAASNISSESQRGNNANTQSAGDPQFDIIEWYPKHQSCQRYFVDHAQKSGHVQAVAAFINIALPFQRAPNPIPGSPPRLSPGTLATPPIPPPYQTPESVSLIPYLRRLVVTGLDFPGVLHGFFGDDWVTGVGPLHEQERRNYLFAAKSGGWASVKKDYDILPLETVPFMRPLQGTVIAEIEAAEKSWSEWLAMEDWMVGPRAPENMEQSGGTTSRGTAQAASSMRG